MRTKSWEDNNGVKRFGFEIAANEVGFADVSRKTDVQAGKSDAEDDFPYGLDGDFEDDLQF